MNDALLALVALAWAMFLLVAVLAAGRMGDHEPFDPGENND